MSNFLEQLKNVTKTPEQIQDEEMNAQRRKEELEEKAFEKCKIDFAKDLAQRIKNDALQKASSGQYENTAMGKIISGMIDISPNYSDAEKYKKVFEHYPTTPNYKLKIKDQKEMRYISWILSMQNVRYKQGKAVWVSALEHSRVDRYVINPLAKQIFGMVGELVSEDNIEIGTSFFVEWKKDDKTGKEQVIRTEKYDDQDEIVVKEGFYEKRIIKFFLYYRVKY